VYIPVALTDHANGILGNGCLLADVAKHVGIPTVTNNPCPHITNTTQLLQMDCIW
jgi:hypothetical protein